MSKGTNKITQQQPQQPMSDDDDDNDEDDDYQYWLRRVMKDPCTLEHAPPHIKNNKSIVMAVAKTNGYWALEFASPSLRKDKDIIVTAVKSFPDSIKLAPSHLKRDPDVLIAAGMFDLKHNDAHTRKQEQHTNTTINSLDDITTATSTTNRKTQKTKIALSTRFSLGEYSYSEATIFTSEFKKSSFVKSNDFVVYAPNAFDKKTCDVDWTNPEWPCRGTPGTCRYNNILTKDGRPTDDCCWRYSYRNQLQEAKDTGGFMLQLVETGQIWGKVQDATLGMGQSIELDMATTMGVKVFQVYCPESHSKQGYEETFDERQMNVVTEEISKWYDDDDCKEDDMSVKIIRFVHSPP